MKATCIKRDACLLLLTTALRSSDTFILAPVARSHRHFHRFSTLFQERQDLLAYQTHEVPPKSSPKDIIQFIEARYGNQEGDDNWTKTRNYLYQTKSLSLGQVQLVLEFLDDYFCQEITRRILQESPRILRKHPTFKLRPIASFLRTLYGPTVFQDAIARNPSLLLTSGIGWDRESHELENYLHDQWKIPHYSIATLQRASPFLFSLPVQKVQVFCAYVAFLLHQGGLDPIKYLKKIVVAHPHLVNLSVPSNLQPRIEFLKQQCELDDIEVALLIQKSSGAILGLSVKENLKPTLDYLRKLLKNDNQVLKKTVMAHAPLLGLSMNNLQQKVDYFTTIMDESMALRILIKCPVVYSLSLGENICPKVEFFQKIWGGTNRTMSFLYEFPEILTLSLEGNIQPTLHFFNTTLYTNLTPDWNIKPGATAIRGRYIAASLFQRLLPRWHYYIQNSSSSSSLPPPPLHVLAGATDHDFCQHLQFDLQEYQTVKDESSTRLKFSSQFDTWLKTGRPIDD